MANKPGPRLEARQDEAEKILGRARDECDFSDKLYELLFNYQERFHLTGKKTYKPLSESERVGNLNLPLSRLYNQIWLAVINLDGKSKAKKQQEVIA